MKKIILILLGAVVLLIGGASLYISLLDWNEHKGRISMQFSSVVGENIEFGGDLKVSLFPHPKMSAKSVSIVNPQTGDTLATIKRLNMAVTLSSILHGSPDIQSLSVEGVELWLKFDENGKSNWARQVAPQKSALNDVRVQILYVRDSIVHIQNKTYGLAFDLTDFAAEIQAEFLDRGPYKIAGNFIYEKERYGLALSIDSTDQADDIGFHIGLRHPSTAGKFVYDGVFNKVTGLIRGTLSGEFTQTSELINKFMQKEILSDKYNIPMQFSAKDVNLGADTISLSNFTVKLDPYFVGTGDLSFSRQFVGENPKKFNLKYQIVDMDVRSMINILQDKFWQYPKEVYMPDNTWSGNFEVAIGRLRVSDNDAGYLANVGVKGSWQQNVLNIDDFYADGQGEVDLTVTGTLTPQHDMPEAVMIVGFQGEDIKTFFQTMNVDLKAPVPNAYQKAKLNAEVKLNPKELQINNTHLQLDNADINGSLDVLFAQKKYQLNADASNLNFDMYVFPLDSSVPNDMISILRHDAKKLAEYKGYTAEADVSLINSTFRGVPLKNAVLNASFDNGELTIEKLNLNDFIGATIDGAGVFKQLDSDLPDIDTFSFNVQTQDLRSLTDKLGIPLPKWSLFGSQHMSVTATISGNYEKIKANAELVSGGDVLGYDGILTQNNEQLFFDGAFEVKTPKLENLLTKVNLKIKDSKVLRGVFNATSQIKGTVDAYALTDANFKIGTATYSGNMNVDKSGDKYSVSGDIKASELNLAQFLGAQKVVARTGPTLLKTENTFIARPNFSKAVFDFSPYKNIVFDFKLAADKGFYENFSFSDFNAKVVNTTQQLSLKDVSFKVGTTNIQGDAVIEYSQAPRVSGNITVDKWPIKKAGGSVYAITAGDVNLKGNYEGSFTSFDDLVGSLIGKLTLHTQEVTINGIDLGAIAEDLKIREYSKGFYQVVQRYLQTGKTKFVPVEVDIPLQGGVVVLDGIALQNSDANLALSGKVNLRDWRLSTDSKVKYKSLPNIDPYRFTLTGALSNPVLDISVESIVRKYDEHWQEIADTEKARKDEAARLLTTNMTRARAGVTEVAQKHLAVASLIDKYSNKNLAPETAQLYIEQNRRLDEIGRIIQSMQNKTRQQNYTDNDIADIRKQTEDLQKELDDISKKINVSFSDDLQQAMAEVRDRIVQLQNRYENIYYDFSQMWEDDEKQLKMINAGQYMTNNTTLQQYRADMEMYQNSVTQDIQNFDKKYTEIQGMGSGSDKLSAIHDLSDIPNSLEVKYKQMQEIHKAAADMLLDIINQQQRTYREEQAENRIRPQPEPAEEADDLLTEGHSVSEDLLADKNTDASPENAINEVGTERGLIKRYVTPADYRTLLPLGDDKEIPVKGGILIRSSDGRQLYEAPDYPPKLLTPIKGETPATGGYIIVR